MPSSPHTPTRRHRFSSIERSSTHSSPTTLQKSPIYSRHGRKSSINSVSSPSSTRPRSSHSNNLEFGASHSLQAEDGTASGLGNLADELAETWEEDNDNVPHEGNTGTQNVYGQPTLINGFEDRGRPILEFHHDRAHLPPRSQENAVDHRSLSPPKQSTRLKHRRKSPDISDYDGSDYGDNSDLEKDDGISASLEHRLAAIESLARRGAESNGSEGDTVVTRVAESLRDLGSQAAVETGATRLATAHTAVATNLAYQTRLIQTLCHQLLSPFSITLDPSGLEELAPLLASTVASLPPYSPGTLSALHSLRSSTTELVAVLSMLVDNLHMIRQTTALASRRLKAAKEAVWEMKKESGMREEGIRWVEKGRWEERLSNRECSKICEDVVDGFEETCNNWRRRLEGNAARGLGIEIAAG